MASLAQANTKDELQERLQATHDTAFQAKDYPVGIWNVFGEEGLPVRLTISERGPTLLSRLLGLNETQPVS